MSFMTFESANGTRKVRWYAVAALVLVPTLLAGGALLAVNDYSARLSDVSAAIVNDDDGAEIDGQTVPLGRQLSAELVEGAANDLGVDGNYDWSLTDDDDAEAGLADGRYAVVVTIPKDFSKNATSFSDAATATQATVSVVTSDSNRIADDAISAAIANAATRSFGTYLSTNYLENIYVGFNTLHDQLGEAADGAGQLADGVEQTSDGAVQLADGADELATGTSKLASGIGTLASGTRETATGADTFAKGVKSYTDGTGDLATGLQKLADGTEELPAQVEGLATGAAGITSGVQTIAQLAAAQPDMTLAQLDALLAANGSSLQALSAGSAQISGGLTQFSTALPSITDGIAASATGAKALSKSGKTLATGASDLADGLDKLADGVDTTHDGATTLSSGVATYADGVRELADGTVELSDGTTTLADGLTTAVDALPTYSESERTRLADVVATPVATTPTSANAVSTPSAVPLLMAVVLLLGALATYLVFAPLTRRALTARTRSAGLAFAGYLPGLAIGIVQGVALAGIAQIVLRLGVGEWFALAGIAALFGATCAALVQGLVALFGNAGRLVVAIAAALALAAALISTAPALLLDLAALLPTSAAADALAYVTTGADGVGGAIAVLVLWALVGFALSTIAVVRQRTVTARQLAHLRA
jgi:putative membrane protein